MKTTETGVLQIADVRQLARPYLQMATAAIVVLGLLGGWAGPAWLAVSLIFAFMVASVIWIGRQARLHGAGPVHVYASAIVNLTATAAIVILTGGPASPFWLLFLVGAITSAMSFWGRAGRNLELLNAGVAAVALIGPELLQRPPAIPMLALAGLEVATLIVCSLMIRKITSAMLKGAELVVEGEDRFRNLMSAARDVIFTLTAEGAFSSLNPAFEVSTGWTRQEWLGRHFQELVDKEDRPQAIENFQSVLRGQPVRGFRLHVTTRTGQRLVVEVNISPHTTGGRVAGVLGIARDMTEEQAAQEALASSEQRFRALIDNSSDAIALLSADGLILYESPSVSRVLGYGADELIGHKVFEYVHPEDVAQTTSIFARVLESPEEVLTATARYQHKNGSWLWIEGTGTNLLADASVQAIVVNYRDVSERKRAEDSARRRASEVSAIYQTTQDLVMERDLSKLLHNIVERAAALVGATGGGLYLTEPEHRRVRCVVSYKTLRDYTGTVLKYGEGAGGIVAETGEALIIDDYRTWPGRAAAYEEDGPFASVMSVPMRWQDRVIGVIHVLEDSKIRAFTQDDLQLVSLFASQAAVAVENARLFESEKQRYQETAAISEIDGDISASLQVQVVLGRIAAHARDLLRADTSAVYLAEPGRPILHSVAALGPDAEEIKRDPLQMGEGILGGIAMKKAGEIVNNAAGDPRAIMIKGTKLVPEEHVMGVPVLARDRLIGLIAVWRVGAGHEFSATDLHFLDRLAGRVALAIKNAQLFESEHQRRQEADTLREAAEKVSSSLNQGQVIELTLDQLARVVPFESASVQLLRDGYLEVVGGRGWADASSVLGYRFPVPGENPNSVVVQERRPLILGNAPEEYDVFGRPPHEHIRSWLGVPLIVRDRVIGMIALDHSHPDMFSGADARMLSAFASQAAVAIENARLFEVTQSRLRAMEAVAQVGAALGGSLELEPLLENILQSIFRAIPGARHGSILLADETGNLRIRALEGYTDARVRASVFPPHSGYAASAFRERRSILIPDARGEPGIRYDGEIPEMLAIQSAIAAPLIVKDRPIGVISIESAERKNAFGEADLHLLTTISAPVALAIENARLFGDMQLRLKEIQAVYNVSTALRSAQTLDEALPIILDQLINLMKAGSAMVDLLDQSTGEIVTALARGAWEPIAGFRTPGDAGGSGRVIATGQPYISKDLAADGLVANPEFISGLNAAVCVPIIAQQKPIGTLWIGRKSAFLEEEIGLLLAVGEMVGSALQRMQLHEQTENQADEILRAYDETLEGWAKALELRDRETEGHTRRVTDLTLQLSERLGISEPALTHIRRGILLHDIGKVGVPDSILKKTGPLSDSEWEEMKRHPRYAYDWIYPIAYLRPAVDIPYCHHEHWDGSGYPRGLKGSKIPLAARIFAVVDVYDALSHGRSYRAAWPKPKVLDYLREQSGRIFDPEVVTVFLGLLTEKRKIQRKA